MYVEEDGVYWHVVKIVVHYGPKCGGMCVYLGRGVVLICVACVLGGRANNKHWIVSLIIAIEWWQPSVGGE